MKSLKTIDEHCNQPPGTFHKMIKKEQERLKREEQAKKKKVDGK